MASALVKHLEALLNGGVCPGQALGSPAKLVASALVKHLKALLNWWRLPWLNTWKLCLIGGVCPGQALETSWWRLPWSSTWRPGWVASALVKHLEALLGGVCPGQALGGPAWRRLPWSSTWRLCLDASALLQISTLYNRSMQYSYIFCQIDDMAWLILTTYT